MNQVTRATGPTIGMALGYFAVLWGVNSGYINATDQAEAVAMAGIAGVHVVNEIKHFFVWFASLFAKKEE